MTPSPPIVARKAHDVAMAPFSSKCYLRMAHIRLLPPLNVALEWLTNGLLCWNGFQETQKPRNQQKPGIPENQETKQTKKRDRQTDRQAGRQAGRQTDRQTDTYIDRKTDRMHKSID